MHFPLKLVSRRMIAPTVAHLSFLRDDGQPLDYIPGQFIQVHFSYADGTPARRSYSLATQHDHALGAGEAVEIAVSYVAGGAATALFEGMPIGGAVDASGPFGRFCLMPNDANRRYLLIGTGTGITPYRAMLPQLARQMAERGVEVHVLPASATFADVTAIAPDGVFFSNGPGDPSTAGHAVELMQQAMRADLPVFGICLGNQVLGRALGFGTYKLKYGHRGINQPVLDKQTDRAEITAHNHGFAVDAPLEGEIDSPTGYGRVEVSHIGLNDNVVEGLRALDIPAFSVQYHPEAAAGPHDANYLFDRFADLVRSTLEASK